MQISNRAIEQINKLYSVTNASSIRVYVASRGCSGPQLGMVLEGPKDDDVVKEVSGIKVAFDINVVNYAERVNLDFENGRFVFLNEKK